MIITLNGIPGSGKSAVGKRVAEKLHYEFISMGMLRRKMAEDLGITLEELNRRGEEDPSSDRTVDEYQEKLGRERDDLIIDGKTSWYFIPHSVKVFLTADYETCARRIMGDDRKVEQFRSIDEAVTSIKSRMASDNRRYMRYYGIKDAYDMSHYDFIVDTSYLTIDEVVRRVLDFVTASAKKRERGKSGHA